jgi:hypothetical protein
VRSAFDAPGEWFYDAKAGRVRYRPMAGEAIETAVVIAPSAKLSQLIAIKAIRTKANSCTTSRSAT